MWLLPRCALAAAPVPWLVRLSLLVLPVVNDWSANVTPPARLNSGASRLVSCDSPAFS